ncbi:MAG: Asparagine synthetase [Clostridia bacterium 62_21]|nr:MAG: Asparagine synthetase [Clostridia bacterium 62_21]
MCGIVAHYGRRSERQIRKMLAKVHHRGPDEDDLCRFGDLWLGHKRLSIIGPEQGHQPIPNETGDISVVVNGEIYNYRELKRMLSGHTFATRSDSEVVVHLYEEMGTDCVRVLDGMFAFVLSDNGRPFAARDTLGIKPLYYAEDDKGIYFSSELKSLIDVVDNVKEFPPGHYYTPETGFKAYRELKAPFVDMENWSEADTRQAMETLREKLEKAVVKRLMADVPLGVLLSGGLDSSLVAAIAKKHTGQEQLNSFCVGMEGGNDLPAAREVARYLGTIHHEYVFTKQEVLDVLPEVIYYLESFDPSLIRSAVPTYFVARLAAEHVKVILSGEGADELFSGYSYLKAIKNEEDLHRELLRSIKALHNINLQRLDRMTMAHSIEGRVPFLDLDLVTYAAALPPRLKLYGNGQVEKWILRKAFEGYLPDRILWRKKEQFAEGCASDNIIRTMVEEQISDAEFNRERYLISPPLRTKEELYYYRIFRQFFDSDSAVATVGRWATA